MLEAQVKSKSGRLLIKVEAATTKDLFERIAEAQEVFDADAVCGACQSDLIRFQVRTVEKFKFYELICTKCFATLRFGQKLDTTGLWPKRRGDAGELFENRGWVRYAAKEDGR